MAFSKGEHLKVCEGDLIDGRFKVVREVGCGNFSKVYSCFDVTRSCEEKRKAIAVKIIKREYWDDAFFEKQMLQVLSVKDPAGTASVCRMIEFFEWKKCPVLVMSIHGPSLRSRRLGYSGGVVTRDKLVQMAYSLLETFRFIHFDCKMVHTDIKPENILLDTLGGSKSTLGNNWVVCDFGSASLWRMDRLDSDLISTRPYRAPEVILGRPWFYAADMWSMGCILFEAATGQRLFDVRDDNAHLQLMEKRLGPLPDIFTRESKNSAKYFSPKGTFLVCSDYMRSGKVSTRSLEEILSDDPELCKLIRLMLTYDPMQRITAKDALSLPIFSTLRAPGATRNGELNTTASSASKVTSAPVLSADKSRGHVLVNNAAKPNNHKEPDPPVVSLQKSASAEIQSPSPLALPTAPPREDVPHKQSVSSPLRTAEAVAPPPPPPPPPPHSPHREELLRKLRRLPISAVHSPEEPVHRLSIASASSPNALSSDCLSPSRDRNGALPAASSNDALQSSRRTPVIAASSMDFYRFHVASHDTPAAESMTLKLSSASVTPMSVSMPLKETHQAQGTKRPHTPLAQGVVNAERPTGAAMHKHVGGGEVSRREVRANESASIVTHPGDTQTSRMRTNFSENLLAKRRAEVALAQSAPKITASQPHPPQKQQQQQKTQSIELQRNNVPLFASNSNGAFSGTLSHAQSKSSWPESLRNHEHSITARDALRVQRVNGARVCRMYSQNTPLFQRLSSFGNSRFLNGKQMSRKGSNNDVSNDSVHDNSRLNQTSMSKMFIENRNSMTYSTLPSFFAFSEDPATAHVIPQSPRPVHPQKFQRGITSLSRPINRCVRIASVQPRLRTGAKSNSGNAVEDGDSHSRIMSDTTLRDTGRPYVYSSSQRKARHLPFVQAPV